MRKRTYYKIKTKDGYFPDFTGTNDLIFDTQYDAEDFVNKNYNLEDFMKGYEIEEFSSDLKEGTSSVYLDMLADYHKALNKAEKLGNVVFTVDLDGENEEEFDTWRSAVKYAKENGFDRIHVSGFGFEGPYGYDTGDYEEYDAQFLDLNKEPINESLNEDVKEIQFRDNDNIEKDAEECPLPLELIPNEMGINLSNVEKVKWEEQEDGQLKKVEIDFNPGDDLEEDIEIRPGSTTIVQKYKEFDSKQEAENFIISEEGYGEMSIRYIPKTKKYRVVWEEIDDNINEDIEKHNELNEGKGSSLDRNYGPYDIFSKSAKITQKVITMDKVNDAIRYAKKLSDASNKDRVEVKSGDQVVVAFSNGKQVENNVDSLIIAKDKGFKSIKPEDNSFTRGVDEDIEKHDTLNPKLFDGEELKPEIKDKIEQIAYQFVRELNEDDIKFTLKDIVLLGSNCSYNYTKDSDLDIHLIADSSGLECPDDLYPLLYSAYRSMFNRNYDITIKGIPAELFVEMDEPLARSNGIYSLNNGWIKKPVQQDIPDLDQDAFDKLFDEWEDKYFKLIGEEKLLTEAAQGDKRYYIKPLNIFCSSKNDILNALVKTDKDCIVYTCKNIEDNSRAFTLGTRDIIYYYEDGILYDKNHVKVMDYDLVIKNEENRKKFDINQAPEQFFDQVYQDRITEDQELTEELDWDDTQDFISDLYRGIVDVYSNYVDKGVEPKDLEYSLASCLDHFEDDDLYDLTTTVTITDDLDTDRPTSEEVENFIEDLYDLRKQSIATEGEYGLGNLVFKEFRNLGYLDHLKDLRKECVSKELSLEKLK